MLHQSGNKIIILLETCKHVTCVRERIQTGNILIRKPYPSDCYHVFTNENSTRKLGRNSFF